MQARRFFRVYPPYFPCVSQFEEWACQNNFNETKLPDGLKVFPECFVIRSHCQGYFFLV